MKFSFVTTLLVFLTTACLVVSSAAATSPSTVSVGCRSAEPLHSGTYTLTINGTLREFIVRVPTAYHSTTPHRVVLGLHWYGGTMHMVDSAAPTTYGTGRYYGLEPLAVATTDLPPTIFVAPQGQGNAWYNTNDSDMAFMDAIVAFVENGLCIDPTQRFVVGFSFGGSMAYAIANARSGVFRAIAVLSGTEFTPWATNITTLPVAFFVAHGLRDPGNLIAKGRLLRDRFVGVNGCEQETALEPAAGSMTHIKTDYRQCRSGYPVTYIAFDGVHEYSPVDAEATTSWLPHELWQFFLSAPPPYTA